jgi:hypothetical protein
LLAHQSRMRWPDGRFFLYGKCSAPRSIMKLASPRPSGGKRNSLLRRLQTLKKATNTNILQCKLCGQSFTHGGGPGRPPSYCDQCRVISRYGTAHKKFREQTIESAYGTPCARCGKLMWRGQELHLKKLAPSNDIVVGSPQGQTAVAQERER